ncbi:hypothetical protein EPI10_028294 [Gossypium australe]|uniref:Uncharacterized protein n=1 Tax=Gossypium australe TaxID=47621 RepID=A0A5B6UZV6_9ROSI|nr:hypothetical protein EPI10_028294 [Gossypium australe]
MPIENPHIYLRLFMEVSDSFMIAARVGLNLLPPHSISTWQELTEHFLVKYFCNTPCLYSTAEQGTRHYRTYIASEHTNRVINLHPN